MQVHSLILSHIITQQTVPPRLSPLPALPGLLSLSDLPEPFLVVPRESVDDPDRHVWRDADIVDTYPLQPFRVPRVVGGCLSAETHVGGSCTRFTRIRARASGDERRDHLRDGRISLVVVPLNLPRVAIDPQYQLGFDDVRVRVRVRVRVTEVRVRVRVRILTLGHVGLAPV